MEVSEVEWTRLTDMVGRLDRTVHGNGKPPMEERLRDYIDERDDHKERNHEQDMLDLRGEMNEKHKENTNKLDRLQQLVYIGMGIMIALESIGLFKVK